MNLFGALSPRFDYYQSVDWTAPNGLTTVPLIGYAQTLSYRNGTVRVEGCTTPEAALWRAARMLARAVENRWALRRALNSEQSQRLIAIARNKMMGETPCSTSSPST